MQYTTWKNQWAYNECKGYVEIQTVHWTLRPGFCRSMDETKTSYYTRRTMATDHILYSSNSSSCSIIQGEYKSTLRNMCFTLKFPLLAAIFETIYNSYLLNMTQCRVLLPTETSTTRI